MKKIITKEQIQALVNSIYELNAPVKFYSEIVKMLNELPEYKEVDKDVEKEEKK